MLHELSVPVARWGGRLQSVLLAFAGAEGAHVSVSSFANRRHAVSYVLVSWKCLYSACTNSSVGQDSKACSGGRLVMCASIDAWTGGSMNGTCCD